MYIIQYMYSMCTKGKGEGVEMLVSISDFAREHGVDPQAVSRYLSRHEELQKHLVEEGKKKLFERDGELYRILEEQYPLAKPTIIVNGVPEEDHREVLERLAKAQELIIMMQNELTDQKLLVAEKEHNLALLEDQQSRADADRERLENEVSQLKAELENERNKTWWQKLRGK